MPLACADKGEKEILLEYLDHLVISSLAVVFIDLGVAVPRDLAKQFDAQNNFTPDIVEDRLVKLKKVFRKQKEDVNLPIFGTPKEPASLEALRVRNQQWRTGYEARLKQLPTTFSGEKCLYLGDGVRYPTFDESDEFQRPCPRQEIPLVQITYKQTQTNTVEDEAHICSSLSLSGS
jgi:hypothetical protein